MVHGQDPLIESLQLKCVAVGRALSSVFLVMEYCEHDLASLVDHMPCPFAEPVVKCLLLQTVRGTVPPRTYTGRRSRNSNRPPPIDIPSHRFQGWNTCMKIFLSIAT